MILEFVGLPGAGKSTLHSKLIARLSELNIPVIDGQSVAGKSAGHETRKSSKFRRFRHYVVALCIYYGTIWMAFRQLAASRRSLGEKVLAFRWVIVALGRYQMAASLAGDRALVVFDEGIMQRAFTLFQDIGGAGGSEAVRSYVRSAPLPDVVVRVRVNPKIALRRLSQRDRGLSARFAEASPEQLLRIMKDGQQMFDTMLEELRASNRSNITVVTFEVEANDLDAASMELEKQLSPLIKSALAASGT